MANIEPSTTWSLSEVSPTTTYVYSEIIILGSSSSKDMIWDSTVSVWGS